MIQNELLPECAVFAHPPMSDWPCGKEIIYSKSYKGWGLKGIPLTAESVAKVEGVKYVGIFGGNGCYEFRIKGRVIEYYPTKNHVFLSPDDASDPLTHITSIHQLQMLIYSLTGTMPKYEIGDTPT